MFGCVRQTLGGCGPLTTEHGLPPLTCFSHVAPLCRPRYVFEPAAANREEVLKAVREMRGR